MLKTFYLKEKLMTLKTITKRGVGWILLPAWERQFLMWKKKGKRIWKNNLGDDTRYCVISEGVKKLFVIWGIEIRKVTRLFQRKICYRKGFTFPNKMWRLLICFDPPKGRYKMTNVWSKTFFLLHLINEKQTFLIEEKKQHNLSIQDLSK